MDARCLVDRSDLGHHDRPGSPFQIESQGQQIRPESTAGHDDPVHPERTEPVDVNPPP
ncbi:MAG: hypothetical protein GY698_18465 [Actinomycetia bacterium]|nr:hypothetical protein [Actinomycetes bacterium]